MIIIYYTVEIQIVQTLIIIMLSVMFDSEHVVSNRGCDLFRILVLAVVVIETAIWSHQVHDDSMIHLEWKYGNGNAMEWFIGIGPLTR